jgi:two-component system nitrogen regulation response regulator GlnG
VRIIAATNRDLDVAMADGTFRSDLYYRLNEYTISLPPLRARGDDIRLMTEFFFRAFAQQLGKDFVSIAPETMQRIRLHSWPGNVRELQGIVKQTLLKASGPVIVPAFLPTGFSENTSDANQRGVSSEPWAEGLNSEIQRLLQSGSHMISDSIHDQVDQVLLREVLLATGGNISEAATRLGISRPTLRNRIRHLELDSQSG